MLVVLHQCQVRPLLNLYNGVHAGLHGSFTTEYLGPQPGTEAQHRQHDIRSGVSRQGKPVYSL